MCRSISLCQDAQGQVVQHRGPLPKVAQSCQCWRWANINLCTNSCQRVHITHMTLYHWCTLYIILLHFRALSLSPSDRSTWDQTLTAMKLQEYGLLGWVLMPSDPRLATKACKTQSLPRKLHAFETWEHVTWYKIKSPRLNHWDQRCLIQKYNIRLMPDWSSSAFSEPPIGTMTRAPGWQLVWVL